MDVEAAQRCERKHSRREDLAEGRNDDDVGFPGAEGGLGVGGPDPLCLVKLQAEFERRRLDRRRLGPASSSGRPVGLGENADDVELLGQPAQGRDGELGRAEEDHPHALILA
jgi:hypothetical protein